MSTAEKIAAGVALWLAAQIPLGMLVGGFIKFGTGEPEPPSERVARRLVPAQRAERGL